MALLITDECINCDVCEPQCPNSAISMGMEIYEIDPGRCTECVGHFDEPQCRAICPVDCIPVDPERIESHDVLLQRYFRLVAETGAVTESADSAGSVRSAAADGSPAAASTPSGAGGAGGEDGGVAAQSGLAVQTTR